MHHKKTNEKNKKTIFHEEKNRGQHCFYVPSKLGRLCDRHTTKLWECILVGRSLYSEWFDRPTTVTQPTIRCLKLTTETLEDVKDVQS